MEYTVIEDQSLDFLKKDVNLYLSAGWKCQGGVSVVIHHYKHISDTTYYQQAMIKD